MSSLSSENFHTVLGRLEELAAQHGLHVEHCPSESGLGTLNLVRVPDDRIVCRGIHLDHIEHYLELMAEQEEQRRLSKAARAFGEQIGKQMGDQVIAALDAYARTLAAEKAKDTCAKVIPFKTQREENTHEQ